MKKIKFIFLLLTAVVAFSCSSSSDDDGGNNGNNNTETYIRFKVNGTQVNMTDPSTLTTLMASISGTKDEGENIRSMIFNIPVDATIGEHDITDGPLTEELDTYSASYSFGDVYVNGSAGTFTITAVEGDYIKGTFSFTGEDAETGVPYSITQGQFRAFKPEP